MLAAVALAGLSAAFVPPATLAPVRVAVEPAGVSMNQKDWAIQPLNDRTNPLLNKNKSSKDKLKAQKLLGKKGPLSPGSNYPTTKNAMIQRNGFGNFVQNFQMRDGKSKYGMPIFLPNGNINPAYLAAERKAMSMQSKRSVGALAGKTKKMKAAGTFKLGDWISKNVGISSERGDYFNSGGDPRAIRDALKGDGALTSSKRAGYGKGKK